MLYAFDLLKFDGKDLRSVPLGERKAGRAKLRASLLYPIRAFLHRVAPAQGLTGTEEVEFFGEPSIKLRTVERPGRSSTRASPSLISHPAFPAPTVS
jgi:hypothetical protein